MHCGDSELHHTDGIYTKITTDNQWERGIQIYNNIVKVAMLQ